MAYRAGYLWRESERSGLPADARTCTSCIAVAFTRSSGVATRMTLSRRLVVWPHHRDTLQLPAADRWRPTPAEAMTWNIFRTLELMPPAFWLRRLNAFLGLVPPRPASVTATVRLWARLAMPPGFGVSASDGVRTDGDGSKPSTQRGMIVRRKRDLETAGSDSVIDPVAMLAYAASWFAGRRDCYVGVIVGSRQDAARSGSVAEK